ncbi:MAG: type I-C CRISPR-associated protein Cas5c [Polyangiales bacterium]
MAHQGSRAFRVRVKGPLACFTRPELKVERVSYEVMTRSAARGILQAICWKPAIEWSVRSVSVLRPVQWASVRRNEVQSKATTPDRPLVIEDERTQRNTVCLRDVEYVIEASFVMTDVAGPDDNVRKFEEMFARRVERGQHHQPPCLGCREFDAEVSLVTDDAPLAPIDPTVRRPLGWMFWDFLWTRPDEKRRDREGGGKVSPRPLFFDAWLDGGVVKMPTLDEVLAMEGRRA